MTIDLLYGRTGCRLRVPEGTAVLEGQDVPALEAPARRVREAMESPIGSRPLRELLRIRRPRTVAITISDSTRPVPNRVFLPPLLEVLAECGVTDDRVVIIVGTGMHRPSTPEERQLLLGDEIPRRVEVIDHVAADAGALTRVTDGGDGLPPASVNRRFVEADFRIATGYIEPHFMAGFSGGRKGVCPALVDLATIQRFHGYQTLADPRADNGVLEGNPCHAESLRVARAVGVDFLLNVAITRSRQVAGVYGGNLADAHEAGCRDVERWTSAAVEGPFDLVVTNGGGFPLDETFYQTVKGQVTSLPALAPSSVLLQISECRHQLGSDAYTALMTRWGTDWQGFLRHIASSGRTELDQWEFQMQCRVLQRIGVQGLWFVSDGIPAEVQGRIGVTPILGPGDAPARLQQAVDRFIDERPGARVAVVPDGPYTLLRAVPPSPVAHFEPAESPRSAGPRA